MKDFQAAADFLTAGSAFPERGFSRGEIQNSEAKKKETEKLGAKLK